MSEVEKLLTEKKIHFVPKGKDVLVKCFNPEHEDSNPSMRIDREEGHFHCLSCGYKGNVFTLFNKYRNKFNSRVRKTKEKMIELRKASWSGYDIPSDAFFVNELWRGIPASVMNKFQAFTTTEMGMEDRIVFPITDTREVIVGFQGRFKYTDATPKYLAYPGGVGLPWFPSANKIDVIDGAIVLVEGLPDALYLHGQGITNAVTTFGTKSTKQDNIEEHLTPYILAGAQKVYIMYDGDEAGSRASEHLEKIINFKTDLVVEVLSLPDGEDPSSLNNKELNRLKKILTDS